MINTRLNTLAKILIQSLGHNRLNGAIPTELRALKNLQDLDLGELAMEFFFENH